MNNKLTDERVSNATLIRLIQWADQHNSHYVAAALCELQERRKADSAEPIGWTNAEELRSVEKDGCGYLFKANPITPNADPRRVIKLYAVPPASVTGIYDDVLNIIGLLENNEWAEHCTSTVLGSLLESEITRLVSNEQSAPVVPEEITDESTEQRLMGRRWAHSFCAGWNACRAAMLKGDAK
ncbi:hypothetical protein HOS28_gp58 [Salmonella phage UPF_BP1]|uniref:hypothetical protein n=1 Tax=Salmonella phage UPF_BP1 TaxID=1912492 RepID=UPI000CA10E3F|nr:hypothetical protein HOS28_gp58 [Salmonella phage UPF_BP1]AOZ63888.1 hypothetical protein [Salmonella phage UPF_BP1]